MSIYLGDTLISGAEQFVGESRNIGQIIPSTIPLQDAGLHLLDGALIQGSGIYSAFVTYIAGLVTDYSNLFCTEADWQTAITNYGVCGKFVYDSVNNTLRLPKITGILEGTTDLTALGDLVQAGLPNITGVSPSQYIVNNDLSSSGALYKTLQDGNLQRGGGYTAGNGTLYFDASRSSVIYGRSNTVQPQTIKVLYYIVIATSTKTEIEVDIDEVITDLNGKADVDLTNCTNLALTKMANASMPSSVYTSLTVGAAGTGYTAPADGWFTYRTTTAHTANTFVYLANTTSNLYSYNMGNAAVTIDGYIPAKKGDIVTLWWTGANSAISTFYFVYAEGSKWES